MIKRIFANGFKGMDFDQPLGQRSHTCGQGWQRGHPLPWRCLFQGDAQYWHRAHQFGYFDAVASGDAFTVGVETEDGKRIERTYKRGKKKLYKLLIPCEWRATPKTSLRLELANEGFCLADVASFHALSEYQKD